MPLLIACSLSFYQRDSVSLSTTSDSYSVVIVGPTILLKDILEVILNISGL
jgi:hypothetical protein